MGIDFYIALAVLLVVLVLCYLIGSINFAIIVTRVVAKKDIRQMGSRNAGMTNVLRCVGKIPALITLIGDFSKGYLALWLGRMLTQAILQTTIGDAGSLFLQENLFILQYLFVFAALIGHCFPIFYRFQGGKGVLVSAGAMLALSPLAFLGCLLIFMLFFAFTRIISVGSIAGALTFPLMTFLLKAQGNNPHFLAETAMALLVATMICVMHRANIKRLLAGQEPTVGKHKK